MSKNKMVYLKNLATGEIASFVNLYEFVRSKAYNYEVKKNLQNDFDQVTERIQQGYKTDSFGHRCPNYVSRIKTTFVLFDDCGNVITKDTVEKYHWFACGHQTRKHHLEGKYKFRDGPVPDCKGRYNRWKDYRYPSEMAERRENAAVDCDEDCIEYEIKVRPSRRRYRSRWTDDNPRRFNDKSWKRHRKSQWKDA